MREIGIRELKGSLSKTLSAVGRGEQVRITRRGRPLADLVPVSESPQRARLRRLVAEGRVVLPLKPLPKRAPRLLTGIGGASDLVIAEREAER